jgi:hypothetical protein
MFIMVMKQSYIYYFIVTMLNKFRYIIIYLARGLPLLKSVSHMFENWLHNQDDKLKKDNNGVVAVLFIYVGYFQGNILVKPLGAVAA